MILVEVSRRDRGRRGILSARSVTVQDSLGDWGECCAGALRAGSRSSKAVAQEGRSLRLRQRVIADFGDDADAGASLRHSARTNHFPQPSPR